MTRYIIDRIENGLAVLEREDGEFITMPTGDLPIGSQQHDCLECEKGCWAIDEKRTAERKAQLRSRLDSLFGRA
ncbi:MAG: DUF3006 domain-containing protein [Slackia faecicanis]|nr:DUF3006 domain-containing protein [Slackia faecicanis]